MGATCCAPDLPLDQSFNPYTAVALAGATNPESNILEPMGNKIQSAFANRKMTSKGRIESVTSKEVGVTPIMPMISPPMIEAPEMEMSGIRSQSYINTIQAAVQKQDMARAAHLQAMHQQAMMQAQMEHSRRVQIEQQRQLAAQQQKEAKIKQHGPQPNIATAAELPAVSEQISMRRKQLKMLKYEGDAKGVMLNPFKFTNNGVVYFGQWNNGHPHGKGLIYFTDGSVFEGGFFEGKPNGKGRLISINGDYYEGTVSGNSSSSVGLSENKLVRYEGEFQNNIPHGNGVQTSLDGKSRFQGSFSQGSKVMGILLWGDNKQYVYQGQFVNNVFEGNGVLKSTSGKYVGEFVNGKKHGKGRYQWVDGRVYEGWYESDMKSGYGQLYGGDGTPSYRGNWAQDSPSGEGTSISNGVQTTGQWANGHFVG